MKVSEIDVDLIKVYLRIDHSEDDTLLEAIIPAAVQYAVSYTGLTEEQLDDYSDIPLAILALCADMYELRQFTVQGVGFNPTADQILAFHSCNLL